MLNLKTGKTRMTQERNINFWANRKMCQMLFLSKKSFPNRGNLSRAYLKAFDSINILL